MTGGGHHCPPHGGDSLPSKTCGTKGSDFTGFCPLRLCDDVTKSIDTAPFPARGTSWGPKAFLSSSFSFPLPFFLSSQLKADTEWDR
jgi:hypothetical protein